MKLNELLPIMNIYDITVRIEDNYDMIDAKPGNRNEVLEKYGEREVVAITNVAKAGDVIVIK